jgi:trehalose 6-phosphate synthase/phosphatase
VSPHPPIQSQEDKEQVTALLAEMNCIPLYLDGNLIDSHYNGFCKQVLWPAFHNIDLLDLAKEKLVGWDQSKLESWWQAYQQVNRLFAQVMIELVRINDIIWVHDYHLSLLPQCLQELEMAKAGRVMTRKVFFLHIPFPTSQIFRELECGEAILQGILHANVVGFHAFDHARHFLNAAKRILGLDYESMVGGLIGVHFQGKTVLVTMSNVSIEPRMADGESCCIILHYFVFVYSPPQCYIRSPFFTFSVAVLKLPSVDAGYNQLKSKHGSRMIIGGLDIGQRLSGVSLKLLAFERLLHDYSSWQRQVVMVQRVLLPNSRQSDEANTVRELRCIVKRIQDSFGPQVIDYMEMAGSSMPVDQRLALWKASDVLMLTPIREGLNHWPMEYIYTRKEPSPPGVVITSEFSAVSSILNGALRVNPFDVQMTVTTMDKALSMSLPEREVSILLICMANAVLSLLTLSFHRAAVIVILTLFQRVLRPSGRKMCCVTCVSPSFVSRRKKAAARRLPALRFLDVRN